MIVCARVLCVCLCCVSACVASEERSARDCEGLRRRAVLSVGVRDGKRRRDIRMQSLICPELTPTHARSAALVARPFACFTWDAHIPNVSCRPIGGDADPSPARPHGRGGGVTGGVVPVIKKPEYKTVSDRPPAFEAARVHANKRRNNNIVPRHAIDRPSDRATSTAAIV